MKIEVIGLGCNKCRKTYDIIDRYITDNGLDVELSKVEDIAQMASFNTYLTPAVAVDGKVVIKGIVPKVKDLEKIIFNK